MKLLKASLITPSIVLMLSASLFGQESYTIKTNTLQEALEIIAKKSNLPYIVEESLIKGKKANSINEINGIQNALDKILEDTNLEAIIKNETIIIRKKKVSSKENSSSLGEVDVFENSNMTEGSSSYTIDKMSTATKLNMSIRDTPQSLVVVTNQQIQDKNLESFQDLAQSIVGFNAPDWDSGRFWVSARGFNIDYYQIDGIPTTYYEGGTDQNLITFDRVEIVRGVNGLTSGAGEPAASINYLRKHATNQELASEITLKTDSHGSYSGSLDISSPLTKDGSTRARVIAEHNNKKTFKDFYEEQTDTIYTIVDADLTDQTSVYLGASYLKEETEGSSWTGVPVFFSNGSLTNFDPSDNYTAKWGSFKSETTSAFAGIEHAFLNDIIIKANYSYLNVQYTPNVMSFLGYPDKKTGLGLYSPWGAWHTEYERKTHAVDLYASIPLEIADNNHEIIIGSSFSKTKEVNYFYQEMTDTNDYIADSVYNWKGNTIKPIYLDPVLDLDEEKKQSSIYATGRFSLREDLKLILGIRSSNYKYQCNYLWSGCSEGYEHKNVLTPFAGITYDINQNHSAYVSYTSIFQPSDAQDLNGKLLDPKEGKNYEVGIKGEYFNKKLNSAITYFTIKQENVSEEAGTHNNGDKYYKTIDGVTSKGIELSLAGEITSNWNVDFGFTSFSVKDKEGKDSSSTTPKKEMSISTKYKIKKLSFGAGISWQDEFYENVTNPFNQKVKVTEKAFYLVNTMAKYDYTKNLSFQLNIDNLLNKKYNANITNAWIGGNYILGAPRTTTLTLKYKF